MGADIAHNLDLEQGDATLPDPAVTVRRGTDAGSIEVDLRYPIQADGDGFSARLNTFTSKDGPVRTNVRYQPESGREQIITVTGPATRVAFDPAVATVLQSFAVRGLRALFDAGDPLLFLVCILLPMRRPRVLARLYIAGAAAQAAVIALYIARVPAMTPWLPLAAIVAASVIAVAALQNIARARLRWLLPLVFTFGALSGWTLGDTAAAAAQFAGAHRLLAMTVFTSVVLVGELWLGLLLWAFRVWLDERALPERIVAVVGSAVVAHSAVHRVMERGQVVAQEGSFGGERVLVWLTLAWIGAMLLVAAGNAIAVAPDRERA